MAAMSFNPQTPQSPSQFSPSVMDQGSSMNTSITSVTASLPTPAHSVNGSNLLFENPHDATMTDVLTKRKCAFEDSGAHVSKKVLLDDPRIISIQDLHLDVGPKYLVCRNPHSISAFHMTEDLFEKFGLTGIAADVARTKPNGEKNALRKTYKGQIKTLGLSGHFDVIKKEASPFLVMAQTADEDWQNCAVSGKEIEKGLSQTHQAHLTMATTMAKGQIPKGLWDSSVLGDLAPGHASKKTNLDQISARPTAPSTPALSATGTVQKSNKPQVPQLDRARRLGKKRSYQDSSFDGYGEGYDDEIGGSSTGEGDDRSKLKRRKQNPNGTLLTGRI